MTDAAMLPDTLYERDFYAWTQDQARALRAAARAGSNLALDWENLAEEIESLGKSHKHALKSHVQNIVLHLLKLEASRAVDPRHGWRRSIRDARDEIGDLLDESPSLRGSVDDLIARVTNRAVEKVEDEMTLRGEPVGGLAPYKSGKRHTAEQILGDWFPPDPQS